ncbi:hypothetical protein NSK_000094 [Nannochloropsis salina CCMP1776]|uniref:Uncharacterized protein n=1 Tax=Nannochloropsis salina CCMP1776 TaxID=1027361 RepID=A0A4D9DAM6_9STRA|nr:hypothetical protein NSK_000094 [Nannochloropsis salina CCMP1776]|eukprot:TFJ88520.1 hypothetical protein NSK_000094 [Nannochloropsis salina CCMP1776]
MCRMQSSGAGNPSLVGVWPAFQQSQQLHLQQQAQLSHRRPQYGTARRRYKYETRLGKGQHGGTMYRARCERGKLWAIEVISDPTRCTAAAALAKQYLLAQDEPGMQSKVADVAAHQCTGDIDLCVPEEMYTDAKTGAWCIVSKLPKESMRQRILSDASYGLETVLNWARQLTSSLAGTSKQEREVVTLDNVFLDEADCVLVGDFLPSASYTPSTLSSEDEEEGEGGEEEEADKEKEREKLEAGALKRWSGKKEQGEDEVAAGLVEVKAPLHATDVGGGREEAGERGREDDAGVEVPQDEALSTTDRPFYPCVGGREKIKKARSSWYSGAKGSRKGRVSPETGAEKASATSVTLPLSREEELRRWGVLMFQVVTKSILPGDVEAARRQILAMAEAERDECEEPLTVRQAILDLLYKQLDLGGASTLRNAICHSGSSSELASLAAASFMSLAKAITDAVLGEGGEKAEYDVGRILRRSLSRQSSQTLRDEKEEQDGPMPVPGRLSRPPSVLGPDARVDQLPLSAPQGQDYHPATRSILAALQQTRDVKMRHRALVALGKLGGKAAVPDVVLALGEILEKASDPVCRRLAAWTVGSMGSASPSRVEGAAVSLIRALGDEEASVRAAAAWALGNLGNICEEKGALATLLHRSVKDADPQVRDMAVKSLARVGRVTGKRRRAVGEDGGDGPALGGRSKTHAKRRSCSLAAATLSMEMASISGGPGGFGDFLRASPTVVGLHHFRAFQSSSGGYRSDRQGEEKRGTGHGPVEDAKKVSAQEVKAAGLYMQLPQPSC